MKRVAWILAGVLAVLAALVAAGAWMTGTASGFRWLAGAAETASSGHLHLEGIEGDLGGPLNVRRIVFVTAWRRIEIEDARLEWQPRALWQRRLEIGLLAARSMRVVVLKKDTTPLALPKTLRLPFALQVRTLDLARLDIVDGDTRLTFGALRGRLDDDGAHYRLTVARVAAPWADLVGQAEIGKDAPFALRGRIDAARREPVPVAARLGLSGTLAALQFRLDARAARMTLMASGDAAPFAAVWLQRLLLAGQGIDPRLFAAGAPAADLAFSGVFEGRAGERLLGTFSLSNRIAGRFDQHRLPLANLSGAAAGGLARADFSALAIDLGAAGKLTGSGQWRGGRFALSLAGTDLDLAALHRDLYATRLRTTLQLAGDAARQTIDATFGERWGEGRIALTLADAELRLDTASFTGNGGRLAAHGRLQLGASRSFSADIDAVEIDPARFGNFPRARLNLRGQVSGALAPTLRLQTQFTLPPGVLAGSPLLGRGRLHYESGHLADADVDVDLAGNRAKLKGAWGRAGDRLAWDVDAPDLARLNLGFSGRLASVGSVSGDPGQPQIRGRAVASRLRLPGELAVDSLTLQLDLQAAPSGAFNGLIDARGVSIVGQRLNVVHADLAGRRSAHTLALDARLPDGRVTAKLAGELDGGGAWRGRLDEAEVEGPWPMRLTAPAALLLSRARQQVEKLTLSVAGGEVSIAQLDRQGGQLATRGRFANLPLAPALVLLQQAPPFTTDLRIDGAWNLRLGDTLDGEAQLVRRSGDVRLADPGLDLGLTRLALMLRSDAGRVTAQFDADTREAGQVRAAGQATLAREGAGFTLPRSTPLTWTLQGDVPDLRLVRPVLPIGVRADARLVARLSGSGSLAGPRIDGRIDASQIRFAMAEEGIAVSDGALALVFDGDRVRVQQGALQGSSGRIVVSGEAQWRNPQAGLTLTFEKFAALNRSDRKVTVSGAARLDLDPAHLQLTGELTADRARLEMPAASRPALPPDVVVVGQPPRLRPARQRLPLALDLRFNLGSDFRFKGAGLDARFGGELRLFTVHEALRGEGAIQVEEGRYAAYGQALDIERGVLRFAGPVDNPGIDVLAVRKTGTVKAGVQVGGTVQRPLVKLYSDPAMSDSEKLSWLVLGHGLENSGQQEFMMLQIAAGALLSQAESANLQAKLADTLGIDTFEVRSGNGEDLSRSVVSVGKRVSSRVTLSYEQSLDGLSQGVRVLYQLTRHLRLEGQTGQQSSFDVFYSLDYD